MNNNSRFNGKNKTNQQNERRVDKKKNEDAYRIPKEYTVATEDFKGENNKNK